jgi:hypothetical protein
LVHAHRLDHCLSSKSTGSVPVFGDAEATVKSKRHVLALAPANSCPGDMDGLKITRLPQHHIALLGQLQTRLCD